jgi:hypothetical protein
MAFEETFVCTALPAGINGTKLRLAVLVSPRLTSSTPDADADLSSWPDAQHWPSISPTWKVSISQAGGPPVILDATEVGAGSYDVDTWDDLFPENMTTTPYKPVDRSAAPIISPPVAAVRDGIRDLHVEVLKNARTDFPTVEALQENDVFQALKDAVHPSRELLTQDPVPDADLSLGDAFGVTELTYSPQGLEERFPTVSQLTPSSGPSYGGNTVTINGSGFIGAISVAFGALPATDVQVSSPTLLTCVAPALNAAGTVDVQVTNENGTSKITPADAYTYELPPVPTVTSVDPNSTNGDRVVGLEVNGSGFLGPVSVYFVTPPGEPATNINVISDTQLTCDTPIYPEPHNRIRRSVHVVTQGGTSDITTAASSINFWNGKGDPPK